MNLLYALIVVTCVSDNCDSYMADYNLTADDCIEAVMDWRESFYAPSVDVYCEKQPEESSK